MTITGWSILHNHSYWWPSINIPQSDFFLSVFKEEDLSDDEPVLFEEDSEVLDEEVVLSAAASFLYCELR